MGTENPVVEEMPKGTQIEIASIRESTESAKAAAKEATESQKAAAAALNEIQAKLATIEAITPQVLAVKTHVTDLQAVIATKSDHIESAQKHADEVRAKLDRTHTAATQKATEAEAQKSRAQSAADAVTELQTHTQTIKASTEQEAAAAAAARKVAEESAQIAKGLAERSTTVEARIAEYEKQLDGLKAQCDAQLKTIEGLLPGATSTGLAHSFNARAKDSHKPQMKMWERWLIGSVALLALWTGISWWQAYHGDIPLTWDQTLLLWLSRLPVAAPLVFFVYYASHEAALAKRLEEDYEFKAATASSFEGFRRQMSEIGKSVEPDSPLAKLCENTLATIANPPGRIYDKHKLAVTPADVLKEATKEITGVGKTLKP